MYIIEVKVRKCTVKWTRPRPSSARIGVFIILDFFFVKKVFNCCVKIFMDLSDPHSQKNDGLPHYVFNSPNHVTFDEQNVETSCEKTFTTINTLIRNIQ